MKFEFSDLIMDGTKDILLEVEYNGLAKSLFDLEATKVSFRPSKLDHIVEWLELEPIKSIDGITTSISYEIKENTLTFFVKSEEEW